PDPADGGARVPADVREGLSDDVEDDLSLAGSKLVLPHAGPDLDPDPIKPAVLLRGGPQLLDQALRSQLPRAHRSQGVAGVLEQRGHDLEDVLQDLFALGRAPAGLEVELEER